MSDQDQLTEFLSLANNFLELADELVEKGEDISQVSAALRFAAARHDVFDVASRAGDFSEEKAQATEFFVKEYKQMFEDNFTDYEEQMKTQLN